MISLPLSTTTAVFAAPPAGAEFDFGGTGYSYGNFVVYNASVFLSIKKGSTQGQSTWGPEFAIGPSALQIAAGAPAGARPHGSDLIFGVRARTYSSDRPWSATTSYVVGDTVIEGNIVYVAILASTNQQPPNATYWTAVSATVFGAFFQPGEVSLSATSQTATAISGGGVVNPCPCGTGGGGVSLCETPQTCQWIQLVTTGPAFGPNGFGLELLDQSANGVGISSTGASGVNVATTNANADIILSEGGDHGQLVLDSFSDHNPLTLHMRGDGGIEAISDGDGGILIQSGAGGTTRITQNGSGSGEDIEITADVVRIEGGGTGGTAVVIKADAGDINVILGAASTSLTVIDHNGNPIFRVNENGDLQGKTGKALVFNL